MGKITAYGQIPEFTPDGNYQVDMEPKYLMGWIREEEETMGLLLNPDFQRGHVWTESQQIAYLEYILRGGKSGRDLYFNNPSWRRRVPRELITNMSAWTDCSGSRHGSGISTGKFRSLAAMSMNLQTGSPAAGPCISTSMNCLQKKPSCNGIWT